MATNVELKKNPNENNANLIRRFGKQMREAGILPRVRGLRFFQRKLSSLAKKEKALKKIAKIKEIEYKKKMGKM